MAHGSKLNANVKIEVEDKTASLYAALWDEARCFSGPRYIVAYGVLIRLTATHAADDRSAALGCARQIVSQVFTVLGLTSLSILLRVLGWESRL